MLGARKLVNQARSVDVVTLVERPKCAMLSILVAFCIVTFFLFFFLFYFCKANFVIRRTESDLFCFSSMVNISVVTNNLCTRYDPVLIDRTNGLALLKYCAFPAFLHSTHKALEAKC